MDFFIQIDFHQLTFG